MDWKTWEGADRLALLKRMLQTTHSSGTLAVDAAEEIPQRPLVSVVMPVRNEETSIRHTLMQLALQTFDPARFEILVVDGESTDATREIVSEVARQYPNVRLYPNPRRWSSAGRNVGVRRARGEIVVIVDGHCEIDDEFLARLVRAFQTSGADCLGRPQPLNISQANRLQRAIAAARASWLGHHPDSFIYASRAQFVPAKSVGAAYRRSVFDRVGMFDESFDACEDVEFNHRVDRAGLRCYFTPEAAVRYRPRSSLRGLFFQLTRYGRGRVRLARKHPETISLKTMLPGLFVVGCVLGLFAMWFSPWLAAAYLAGLAFYVAVVLGVSARSAVRNRDYSLLLFLPAVFLAIHWGSGVGLLWESFRIQGLSCSCSS